MFLIVTCVAPFSGNQKFLIRKMRSLRIRNISQVGSTTKNGMEIAIYILAIFVTAVISRLKVT
jgi:hypothetical protein